MNRPLMLLAIPAASLLAGCEIAAQAVVLAVAAGVEAGIDAATSDAPTSAQTSMRVSCADLKLSPVTNPTQRIEAAGFSFLPPSGSNWCLQEGTAGDTNFFKHELSGTAPETQPSREQMAHSFVARAIPARVGEPGIVTVGQLRFYIARWLHAGSGTRMEGDRVVLDTALAGRFALVDSEVSLDPSRGDCITYRSVTDERDNPRMPGAVLQLHDEGVVCLDRSVEGGVAMLVFGERSLKGSTKRSETAESVRAEAQAFLGSLELMRIEGQNP